MKSSNDSIQGLSPQGKNSIPACLAVCLLLSCLLIPVQALENKTVPIPTFPVAKGRYYPFITFLSRGAFHPFIEPETNEIKGRAFRAALLEDAMETDLFIEEIRGGKDGCCISLWSVKQLDLQNALDLNATISPVARITFLGWTTETSFEITLDKNRFLIWNIDRETVQAKRLSP